MDIERKKSTFIRDLLIKVVLIVLFVFLLTILFPMPNLNTFYDAVFNDNVQSMKDAAESWFTEERMPKEVGDEEKLTLQNMLDKKIILPFLDKDGNECDAKKSYVSVTKEKNEYVLKVYLSCNGKSDYIIEPIGCYNFCPDGKCNTNSVETDEKTGEVTVNGSTNKSNTPSNTTSKPSSNTPSNEQYKLQYLYKRTITSGKWTVGEYQNTKEKESSTVKLVNTRTQYTGQKKVTSGTTLYKHVKYAYKDNWTYDTDWTEEVKSLSDNLKLYAKRILYTGQKKIENFVTQYKHVKYAYKDNWKETEWSTTRRAETDTVVLLDTRYTVRKTVKTTTGTWSGWVEDTTWRTSKPADTATKQWFGPSKTKTATAWITKYNSFPSIDILPTYSGNLWYELLYSQTDPCTGACNGKTEVTMHYYRVHEKQTAYSYLYKYRTYSETSTTSTDEKVVSDPSSYVSQGYTIVKTEYRYKINNREKYIVDTKWTESQTPSAGYEYANERRMLKIISYNNLGAWVTNSSKLGEYTYNVKSIVQYKYMYNNKEKYIYDTIWTTSSTSPNGYTYTGEKKTKTKTSYADLGKWVNSKSELGEYTYNVQRKNQYKYKHYTSTNTTESKWFDNDPKGNWVYANQTRKIKIN